jgi:acylphosphatase
MLRTYSIIVTGKVQGVFYRQSTKEKAMELGVEGTVMNRPDGSVEIRITTTEELANQLLSWCKTGPPKARVSSAELKSLPYQEFSGFRILR